MHSNFVYKFVKPEATISDFVESIGMFQNPTDSPKEVVVMPDGRVDLFFSVSASQPYHVTLVGLETFPETRNVLPHTHTFVVSFKPLAVEYILKLSIADIINSAKELPHDYWEFTEDQPKDFEAFCQKVTSKIISLLPQNIDNRKRKLFDLIYASNGSATVKQLADEVGWSSRQINRYFNQTLGLSLKAYCTILRFRKSLEHIAHGKLFPEEDFTDQTYFIKEIKKFSGVVPKELSKNKNDRFVLLSVLKQR
ncbi:AraC family transcriptional regulator [Flavobacterium sp. Sd200]|uniref:helix-turn-helix domain-containing protein n=1 Tax=Flavobacterium sp. Sd200 TaxID=2692211 RepID=UPI00136C50FC|nr:AraC family transcriptional regulator [Flavobacterium sp. Sd200]MXN90131.1 AraC family transcriptional regulator [Flavobacterium sp. Sd200]